jgi:Helicase associated domain
MVFNPFLDNADSFDDIEASMHMTSIKRRYNVLNSSTENMRHGTIPTFKLPDETNSNTFFNIFHENFMPSSICENFSDNINFVSSEEDSFTQDQPRKRKRNTLNSSKKFRPYQAEKWQERFEELLKFRKDEGHCLVPHTYPSNPALARWVKRQRYQYKLLQEGKPSSITHDRIKILEDIGFVWDSHEAAWHERLSELMEFKSKRNSCLVPSNYPEQPQLATWVKCQRRQYKLYWEGRPSNMTVERIMILEKIGFEWELRSSSYSNKAAQQEAKALDSMLPLDTDGLLLDILSDISDEDDTDLY